MANQFEIWKNLQLGSKSSWYYWFYPHGGKYLTFPGNEDDKSAMVFAVRPNSGGHWFLKGDHTIVVTELAASGPGRRHSYRHLVQNNDSEFSRAFNLVGVTLLP